MVDESTLLRGSKVQLRNEYYYGEQSTAKLEKSETGYKDAILN